MWRGRVVSLVGLSAVFAVSGCGSDAVSGPRMSPATSEGLTAADAQVVMKLAQAWGTTIQAMRNALLHLRERHGDSTTELNVAYAQELRGKIARAVEDSTAAVSGERAARLRRRSGASFDYTGLPSSPGIIDPDLSMTRFYLPINPELYMITVVNVPAFYIRNRTTGTYVKQGQTYGIMETEAMDFQPPDAPGQPIPFIPYLSTWGKNVPILVDCSKVGIEAMATTIHQAGWMIIGDVGIMGGTYSTTDTDRNACPHVAPTAHFQMSMYGTAGGTDNTFLEATEAGEVDLSAMGTERDKPIVSYVWSVNGQNLGSSFYGWLNVSPGNSYGVRLDVTDELGMKDYAESVVLVRDPAPPSGTGQPAGGGYEQGQGEDQVFLCTYWEVSYDYGNTWWPDGKTCIQVM